jgi:hypothetical protein
MRQDVYRRCGTSVADAWEVEYTDQFGDWWDSLSDFEKDLVGNRIDKLEEMGPGLGRPLVDQITSSRHANMKELRCGSIRVLFAFDPRTTAILLLGGNKRGTWNNWYRENIPIADRLYDEYLDEIRKEGLI